MTLPAANPNSGNYFYATDNALTLGNVEQSPMALILYTVDYTSWLGADEVISSAVVNVSADDLIASPAVVVSSLDDEALAWDDRAVSFTLTAGTADDAYEVDIIATTNIGEIKVDRLYLNIFGFGATVGEAFPSTF